MYINANSDFNKFFSLPKQEIIRHICKDFVQMVPIFKMGCNQFVSKALSMLRREVYLDNDFIQMEDTDGDEMYFIRNGTVNILIKGRVAATLDKGDYFGGNDL